MHVFYFIRAAIKYSSGGGDIIAMLLNTWFCYFLKKKKLVKTKKDIKLRFAIEYFCLQINKNHFLALTNQYLPSLKF